MGQWLVAHFPRIEDSRDSGSSPPLGIYASGPQPVRSGGFVSGPQPVRNEKHVYGFPLLKGTLAAKVR